MKPGGRIENRHGRRFVAVVSLLAASFAGPVRAGALMVTGKTPVVQCFNLAPGTLAGLRLAELRLAVSVNALRPGTPPVGAFVVSLLTQDGARRDEVSRFAVHPLRGFTAGETRRQQSFQISLEGQARLIENGRPLCVEIGFASESGGADMMAEIDVAVIDVTGARRD